jgi:hypothetical protein
MMTARTPYFHWGQATMFKALAHLLLKLDAGAKEARVPREAEPAGQRP